MSMEKPFDICGNWIPCTEQLPENNTWVLYSDKNGVVSDCHYYNGFNQFEHSNGEHEMTDIIAWMPLPEPYKADKRSKIRCNTCKNNDDEFSGECYECVKNIQNHYEPKGSEVSE